MSFFDKYPKLKDKPYLVEEMVRITYSTMALEDQTVEKSRIEELVLEVLKEQELTKA